MSKVQPPELKKLMDKKLAGRIQLKQQQQQQKEGERLMMRRKAAAAAAKGRLISLFLFSLCLASTSQYHRCPRSLLLSASELKSSEKKHCKHSETNSI